MRDNELLWGRAIDLGMVSARFGLGLSWFCVEELCRPIEEEGVEGIYCPHQDVIGYPYVMEVSLSAVRFVGLGIQVHGNVNKVKPFTGLAVVLKAGFLR